MSTQATGLNTQGLSLQPLVPFGQQQGSTSLSQLQLGGGALQAQPSANNSGQTALVAATRELSNRIAMPPPPPVTGLSRALLVQEMQQSLVTRKLDQDQVRRATSTMMTSLEVGVGAINQAVEHLHKQIRVLSDKLVEYASKLMDKSLSGGITAQEKEDVTFIMNVQMSTGDLLVRRATQSVEATQQGINVAIRGSGEAMGVIVELRSKQLDLFKKALELATEKEAHDVKLACEQLDASLREEEQYFNQLKQVAQLEEAVEAARRQHALDDKKLDHEQEQKLRALENAAEKARLDYTQNRFATELQADVTNLKNQLDARTALNNQVKEVQLAEINKRGSCSIM